MADTFGISLNEPVNRRYSSNRGRGWGWGMGRGRGGIYRGGAGNRGRGRPLRANVRPPSYKIAKSFSRARDMIWKHDLFNDSMAAAGLAAPNSGTKLYISNLDYGVSNEDIKELFTEVGELKRSMVHYDRNGRPSGSAEVIFIRRSDALTALKRYNNVQLDGKAMKIEIIGDNIGLPASTRVNIVETSNGREQRSVTIMPKLGQAGAIQFNRLLRSNHGGIQAGRRNLRAVGPARGGLQAGRGRGTGRGRGRGRGYSRGRGRGRKQPTDKSADELDKELEDYHAEAMNTS